MLSISFYIALLQEKTAPIVCSPSQGNLSDSLSCMPLRVAGIVSILVTDLIAGESAGQDHIFWQHGGPSLVSAARFPTTEATLTLSHGVPVY
jgi:hypothetical protein